jgi:hypothetical protein
MIKQLLKGRKSNSIVGIRSFRDKYSMKVYNFLPSLKYLITTCF